MSTFSTKDRASTRERSEGDDLLNIARGGQRRHRAESTKKTKSQRRCMSAHLTAERQRKESRRRKEKRTAKAKVNTLAVVRKAC